ncbi:MAG: YlxR family protein [Candidatus Binatia bacterium]
MTKKNHLPERTCLGCGTRDRTTAMIRLTVIEEGQLELNKQTGRGGYLHRDQNCWKMFINRKNHFRAFHTEISRAAREQLVQRLKSRNGE